MVIKYSLAFQIHVAITNMNISKHPISIQYFNKYYKVQNYLYPNRETFVYLFLCSFYFGKYILMKTTESSMVHHRQMTWKDIDPQPGLFPA